MMSNGTHRIPDLEHFTRRVISDAVADASRTFWLKRAEDFERAKPTAEDFNGKASIEELRQRWRWCHNTAQACRNKAAFIAMYPEDFDAELADMLDREADAA